MSGSVLVVAAGFVLLWSAVTTSTAQLSASTNGAGSFSAGTVELDQPETTVSLLFDADGLFPGQIVSSCVTLAYEGSLPAEIRLHAARSGGTGLEDHVELRLSVLAVGSCPDQETTDGDLADGEIAADGVPDVEVPDGEITDRETPASRSGLVATTTQATAPSAGPAVDAMPVFVGLLGDLWRTHPDYADGLVLVGRAEDGDRLVLDAEVEMVGGDEAQGRTTEFSIIIEARP